jgi:hypothetical protein
MPFSFRPSAQSGKGMPAQTIPLPGSFILPAAEIVISFRGIVSQLQSATRITNMAFHGILNIILTNRGETAQYAVSFASWLEEGTNAEKDHSRH